MNAGVTFETRLADQARSPVFRVWYFIRRWPILPIVILTVMGICAIGAPWLAPNDPIKQNLRNREVPPIWSSEGTTEYVMGTDHLGRDIFSRAIHGARISIMVAVVSLTTGTLIGTALGLIAGWYGGMIDELISRVVDIWYALPFLLVALVIVVVLGQSVEVMMGILALIAWSQFVRNVRAEVLTLKTRDYVALARVAGGSPFHIMYKHILPGVFNTIVVIATLNVGGLILAEATLSFLGAGLPSNIPAWGLMVAEGRDYLRTAWWIAFWPGLAIFLTVMSLNFLGDWLRDRWDPRLRQI